MMDTDIDNTNLDAIKDLPLGSTDLYTKKMIMKEEVKADYPLHNDDFWHDCVIEEYIAIIT